MTTPIRPVFYRIPAVRPVPARKDNRGEKKKEKEPPIRDGEERDAPTASEPAEEAPDEEKHIDVRV
jgi:hypothetical protein